MKEDAFCTHLLRTLRIMSGHKKNTKKQKSSLWPFVWLLILTNILVFQLSRQVPFVEQTSVAVLPIEQQQQKSSLSSWNTLNPLAIPPGQAKALPSLRDASKAIDQQRKFYGGHGDAKHLGGFTQLDPAGISPNVWRHMMQQWNVHSVLDVGCGRGISTLWFQTHGAKVLCVEGSHDATQKSFLHPNVVVEHDFARGPWWPADTYDVVWCVEFLEHVSRQYHFHYLTAFRKAAIVMATSSRWGGWHHVEVHYDEWWIQKMTAYGFIYSEELTDQVRKWATQDIQNKTSILPTGEQVKPTHISSSMKVFINPVVAALPSHQHLFFEHGCFQHFQKGVITNRKCGTGRRGWQETELPQSFLPLPLLPEMDQKWEEAIRAGVEPPQKQNEKK